MEEKNELVNFTSSIGADGKERPRPVSRPIPEPARHVALFGAAYAVCPPALQERRRQAAERAGEASEQQDRRDLKTRRLPAPPRTASPGEVRPWIPLVLPVVVAALAVAGWRWRDVIVSMWHP